MSLSAAAGCGRGSRSSGSAESRPSYGRPPPRPGRVSYQPPSFVQKLRQDSPPRLRPLDKRDEPTQLEIGDGRIQAQPLLGTLSTARFVPSQESLSQPLEAPQRASLRQAEE